MNKGQLRAHFLALLNRSDCTDTLADTFIDLALGRIYRTLRIPAMEKQQSYAFSSAAGVTSIVLPSDFLEAIALYYGGQGLVRLPLHTMVASQATGTVGIPQYFTRQQGTFLLHPKPASGTLILDYYGELDALVADTDTNELTILASDAITYMALGYAGDYFLDERGQLFEAKASGFLAEIQEQADTAETSGSLQVIRPLNSYQD
jgi:hypothetical protein